MTYEQVICTNGHYDAFPAEEAPNYETWLCSHCGANCAWYNSVSTPEEQAAITEVSFEDVKQTNYDDVCATIHLAICSIPEGVGHRR